MTATLYQIPTGERVASRGAGPGGYPRAVFARVEDAAERADEVRGDPDDLPDDAAIYIGETTAKHYYTSHDLDGLPDDLRDAAEDAGLVIVDGVLGGWSDWDGRPEWSEWYLDVTGAEVDA